MKNKTCTKCNQELSVKMFYKTKNKYCPDGLDYYCKECRKISSLKSHRGGVRKPECTVDGCERLNYAKTYCRIHYERFHRKGTVELKNNIKKNYGKAKYDEVRREHLKSKFKLTLEEYYEMCENNCEICGENPYEHKILHVDHDHKCCPVKYDEKGRTGYFKTCGLCVRGVLCNKCNTAVGKYERGLMRDDYPLRDKIIIYVAKYNQLISDRIESYDKEQGTR